MKFQTKRFLECGERSQYIVEIKKELIIMEKYAKQRKDIRNI